MKDRLNLNRYALEEYQFDLEQFREELAEEGIEDFEEDDDWDYFDD